MSWTLAELKKKVYSVLRDSEKGFTEDWEVEDWLNEAYLDLVSRLRILRKETTGTTSATGTVTVPTDYIETVTFTVLAASGDTEQTQVEFVDDKVFDSWRLGSGDPENQLARIFNGTLETYPVCASVAYTWRYVYEPTDLDSAADTPSLPKELQMRLVHYARAHAKWKEGEDSEGDRYYALYSEGLPMAPLGVHRERPGTYDIRPIPGWYDE